MAVRDYLPFIGVTAAATAFAVWQWQGGGTSPPQSTLDPQKGLAIFRFTIEPQSGSRQLCGIEGEWQNYGRDSLRYPIVHAVFRNRAGVVTATADIPSRIAPLAAGQRSVFDSLVPCAARNDRPSFTGTDGGGEIIMTTPYVGDSAYQ